MDESIRKWILNDLITKEQVMSLRASELLILLAQGHPIKAGLPKDWLSVSHAASVDDNEAKEIW